MVPQISSIYIYISLSLSSKSQFLIVLEAWKKNAIWGAHPEAVGGVEPWGELLSASGVGQRGLDSLDSSLETPETTSARPTPCWDWTYGMQTPNILA